MNTNPKIQITCLSLAGRKHREKGNPCEDASLAVSKDGVDVICLSDGAGGSKYTHADLGSKCVVQIVCDLMVRHFDAFFFEIHESVVRSVLIAAIQAELAIVSKELALSGMEKLSATMLFCAIKDSRMICGHIGDGIIARVTGCGLQPITLPQNGEDASSTLFVTLPDAQDYLRVIRTTIDDTHAVVLMTDGIAEMVFDATKLFLLPVVARLAEIAALSKEESDIVLSQTIRSFIIDASPLSDDASIGILYLSGTPIPDLDSLPSDKDNCIQNSGDDMRTVQNEISPRVRQAQAIVIQGYAGQNNIADSNADNESTRAIIEEEKSKNANRNTARTEAKPFITRWRKLLLAVGIIFLVLLVGISIYILVFL